MSLLTPKRFYDNWHNTTLNERQSYQAHFIELCQMMGYPTPTGTGRDAKGNVFKFEESGDSGFADVYLEGHFAIEYKAPEKYKDLTAAYQQLQKYREQLKNPPLLIVTDIAHWEIHTNFENSGPKVYKFDHSDLAPDSPHYRTVWGYLDAIFDAPRRLHPDYNTAALTLDAARGFQRIADQMRLYSDAPIPIAHFLTKIVFCLFAEDIHLLPLADHSMRGVFSELIYKYRTQPARFRQFTRQLFEAMNEGGFLMLASERILHFNGSLFADINVEEIQQEELDVLHEVSQLDWAEIEPAIFGTLFEGALDKRKRAQLGAHYTSREDILLIIEPVLMTPLRREWADIKAQAVPLQIEYQRLISTSATTKKVSEHNKQRETLRQSILQRVRSIKVFDPACGSGNFLYVALQRLMTLEKEIIMDEVWQGLSTTFFEVHPKQMYGLERDPIAHALASIVVWIGYIQWRTQNIAGGFGEPILQDLNEDNIRCMDAILAPLPNPPHSVGRELPSMRSGQGPGEGLGRGWSEPEWPTVDVIVGNPPFLGDKKMRGELGNEYVTALRKLYEGRVPGGADLVCYWFEKARAQIKAGKAQRAGLLSTNSIRGGANQEVLKRIKKTGDIFMAWADRAWILEGAAVRISMVGFDDGSETEKTLDEKPVSIINADLTAKVDIIGAKSLTENSSLSFIGTQKGGPFDIDSAKARQWINDDPKNANVVRPWLNGSDVTGTPRNMWIIDFGAYMSQTEASTYEAPFAHVEKYVHPKRENLARSNHRERWWLHAEARPGMRQALAPLKRFIITPMTAKHRLFVWCDINTVPENLLVAIARDDDYFFGVLHSKIHEVWSLRMGTWLGKGNDPRYTPTTTFETFPFPYVPGKEPLDDSSYQAIAAAAKQLHEERQAWLNPPLPNPPHSVGRELPSMRSGEGPGEGLLVEPGGLGRGEGLRGDRTLTNLYNALNVFRGTDTMKIKPAAGDFAPRLAVLHDALDAAVCAAYGWDVSVLADDEAILARLLALNAARA